MEFITEGKSYIDKVEAFEIMLKRGIDKLPRKGKEVLTVRQVPLNTLVLGKDEQGFYLDEIIGYK